MEKVTGFKLIRVSQFVAIIMIMHSAYIFFGLKQVSVSKILILFSSLPLLLSSVLLLVFAVNLLLKKKMSVKMLVVGSLLSWFGCLGWFLGNKIYEGINDWKVFYSPISLFPLFLIIYFTRPKVKEQFK